MEDEATAPTERAMDAEQWNKVASVAESSVDAVTAAHVSTSLSAQTAGGERSPYRGPAWVG
eukprot:3463690-Lingulodinium_polyedra.AAC.1